MPGLRKGLYNTVTPLSPNVKILVLTQTDNNT